MKHPQHVHDEFDYSFPNAVAIFWFFVLPMILILILVLFKYSQEIWTLQLNREDLQKILFLSVLSLIFVPLLAALLANSFPALRIISDGLEIRFYLPKMTTWIFLPWNEIDRLELFSTPRERLFKKKGENIFIHSKRLPFYYYLPSIFFRRSFSRGVIVMESIRNHDELVRLITLNKDKTGL